MLFSKKGFILGCLLISLSVLHGQGWSNLRAKSFTITSDTLLIDSFSIVPHSLSLRDALGNLIDTSLYDFFPLASKIIFKKNHPPLVVSHYRTYPFQLAKNSFHKSYSKYVRHRDEFLVNTYDYFPDETSSDKLIDFGNLDYSGNFSRGFTFGSNQDVTLNSAFNLQMQGNIGQGLEVTAAISDNSIPIQPDGNTQQIQEFDKIFIQLKKDKHKITVGDFDMYNPETYFLKYSKKSQGGTYSGAFNLKKGGEIKTTLGGGINRGKFARNYLTASEGNQGPYKLTGTNGETYILVLANTEEVFINGQKLTRGFNNDYVIDYNLGTITFMPKRIITKDLRIMIEFEYSEQNFQRSMVNATVEWQLKNLGIKFNAYSEQDSKNQNVQQNLSPEKKAFLVAIGDSTDKAFYKGYDTASFDINRILYRKIDTFFIQGSNILPQTYFQYSTNNSTQLYSLNFALLGDKMGHYIYGTNNANGRVYQFAPPVYDSINKRWDSLQGNYEPMIKLVAPRQDQMFTLAADYKINAKNKISVEGAVNHNDANTLSPISNNDNTGGAAKLGYTGEIVTKQTGKIEKEKLTVQLNYEFTHARFRSIERYRSAEFNRDFNTALSKYTHTEHFATANFGYNWGQMAALQYRFRTFLQDSTYQGLENRVGFTGSAKQVVVNISSSFLNSTSLFNQTSFIRPQGDITYTIHKTKGWKIGASFYHEINKIIAKGVDTLTAQQSHLWQNYKFFLATSDSATNQMKLEYTFRSEQDPKGKIFDKPRLRAHTLNLTGNISTQKNHTLDWTLTYRRVDERDTTLAVQQLKNYYLGRINYGLTAIRGFIRANTLYEIGAGREQKVQLIYVASPNAANGDYIYRGDLNDNGVKDLNEFVAKGSSVADTTYVRTFSVTPEYIPVNSIQYNQTLNLNPAAILKKEQGVGGFIRRFSMYASLQLTKKIYANNKNKTGEYFNPFPTSKTDSNLVSVSLTNRNSLFFNRNSAKFNMQLDVNYSRNRTLLTSGNENRSLSSQTLIARWNIYKGLNINSNFSHGYKANQSDFFLTQQYKVYFYETNHELSYLFNKKFRVSSTYYYGFKTNKIANYGGQFAVINKLSLDGKMTLVNKTTVELKMSYAAIGYGDKAFVNPQAEFVMLEGLKNGNNYIWGVALEQKLSESIQLLIGYDGRKAGSNKLVNTGRAEIRALF